MQECRDPGKEPQRRPANREGNRGAEAQTMPAGLPALPCEALRTLYFLLRETFLCP